MRKIIAGIIFFSMLISLPTTVTAAGEDEPPDTTGATDETTPRTARASSKTTEPFTEDPPDIMGNAQIVEKQEIIFSDGAFEFISVTTKNGNVFYIFIRHDLEAGAANVYFLNKVDERDLLSLLAADEIDDVVTSASRPAGVTQKTEPDASKSPEPAPPQKEPQSADAAPAIPLINIIIVGGVIVIVCGVLLFTRFKHKRETGPNRGEEDEEDEYEGGNDYPDDDYDKGD